MIPLLYGGSREGGQGDGVSCSGRASHFGGGDNTSSLISRDLESNNFGFFLRMSFFCWFLLNLFVSVHISFEGIRLGMGWL